MKCSDCAVASTASRCSFPVRAWLMSATTSSRHPENTASTPSIQWKVNNTNRNTGVHGASKKVKAPLLDPNRWIASRSRSPVAGSARSAGATERSRIARSTRGSSRACSREPARASTRPRA